MAEAIAAVRSIPRTMLHLTLQQCSRPPARLPAAGVARPLYPSSSVALQLFSSTRREEKRRKRRRRERREGGRANVVVASARPPSLPPR